MKRSNFEIGVILLSILICALLLTGCSSDEPDKSEETSSEDPTEDDEIQRFVQSKYIELDKISHISKFRSGIGHDYSDNFESCRSMKHYFVPRQNVDPLKVKIFSPVDGTVTKLDEGWAGTQVHIESDLYPLLTFILFHVNVTSLQINDSVSANEQIGFHIGSQTSSDIAVSYINKDQWKLLSFFDLVTEAHFELYQDRGVLTREEIMISKQERDDSPLNCDGETFLDSGNLENWIYLN